MSKRTQLFFPYELFPDFGEKYLSITHMEAYCGRYGLHMDILKTDRKKNLSVKTFKSVEKRCVFSEFV